MRKKINQENYEGGDKRIVKRFLLFPMLLNDEWRWLENCNIVEQLTRIYRRGNSSKNIYEWSSIGWLD